MASQVPLQEMMTRLRADVESLVTRDGRLVGSAGHASARNYLITRARALGLEGYLPGAFELPYECDATHYINVIARLSGTRRALPPILLAAHYDTCGPYPGADDNAAAMAILLSAVEPLRKQGLERDVLFAFFDAEEPPTFLGACMGSTHWYTQQRLEDIHFALVMDLCGHDVPVAGLEDVLFLTGMESDPGLAQIVRAREPRRGIRIIPTLNRYIGDLSDHHIFRLDRRPYLFLSCGHWAHYHAPTDTPEKLNYLKMAHIARYVVAVAAAAARSPLEGPFEGYDSTETELYFLRKNAGPMLAAMGLPMENRADIDRFVRIAVQQLGL